MSANLQNYISPAQVREKIYGQGADNFDDILSKAPNNFSLTGGQKSQKKGMHITLDVQKKNVVKKPAMKKKSTLKKGVQSYKKKDPRFIQF